MLIFLKSCRLRQPALRVGVPVHERRRRRGTSAGGHRDVLVGVDAELLVQRRAGGLLGHQLVEVGAGAEVVALAADDEHLDVVVDAGLEDQVAVAAAGADRRDVELVGPVRA